MNCPDCGTDLPTEAQFCSSCGASVAESCPDCGAAVPADANFCSGCGADLSAGTGATDGPSTGSSGPNGGTDSSADDDVFRLDHDVFARRISGSDLGKSGLLARLQNKRQVKIEAGNEALVLRNGELAETLGPGKHTLDSIPKQLAETRKSQSITVVLVERGETPLSLTVEDLLTAGDVQVTVDLGLVAAVDDETAFLQNLMSSRETVTKETFRTLLGPAIQDELQARISEYDRASLYGNNQLKRELETAVKERTADLLARNGMALVGVRSFEYDDGRDDIRQQRTEVTNRAEREGLKDETQELDEQARERETRDSMHASKQQAREDLTANAASHEVEMQETEQRHEVEDAERTHRHEAEQENVDHRQEVETTKTEGEVERRELEHEQDVSEMQDMMDLKAEKERTDIELEEERIAAREDVDAETLASLEDTGEVMDDLARMDAAEDLSAEQLDSLGARDSDELAKARQEAQKAEAQKQRVEDQKEFREDLKDVAADAMDRTQRTSESAMDNMGETASEAARDTPETEVHGLGGRAVGGSDGGDADEGTAADSGRDGGTDDDSAACPECGASLASGDAFCTECGTDLRE